MLAGEEVLVRPSLLAFAFPFAIALAACSAGTAPDDSDNTGAGNVSNGPGPSGSSVSSFASGSGGNTGCEVSCSPDLHQVIDCQGTLLEQCSGTQGCNAATGTCTNACEAAVQNASSVGCEYYATFMDQIYGDSVCFAAFVANTGTRLRT
jgi:hypothetical protein